MQNRPVITAGLMGLVLFLGGCQIWQPGGVRYKSGDGVVSLEVPADWMFSTVAKPPGAEMLATKEGTLLQRVVMQRTDLKAPLPYSKRQLDAQLLPFELAEAVIDDLRADRERLGLEVRENSPAEVAGRPGFKLQLEYRAKDMPDLRLLELRYGAIIGSQLCLLVFTAPARHYFERDLEDFDAMAKSLTLIEK